MKRYLTLLAVFLLGGVTGAGSLLLWAQRQQNPETGIPSHFENALLTRLPFDGEWLVFWGGGEKAQNAHHGVPAQNLALDLVKVVGGGSSTHDGDGSKNENYSCWAQPIYSPTDGIVEIATDGVPDNPPGEMNPQMVYGNSVLIRHPPEGYAIVLAHLKNGSVVRKKGDKIKTGDLIGLCGNSGNSSEPHLHFHVQSEVGYEKGVALRPVFLTLALNGKLVPNYSPVKSDKIADFITESPKR